MDEEMAQHIFKNQIAPALRAEELGGEVKFVNTDPDAEGVEVMCRECGRTAHMLGVTKEEVEGRPILCPKCL